MARRSHRSRRATLQTAVQRLRAGARNAVAAFPGRRPSWVVVELSGSYPPRTRPHSLWGASLLAELGLGEVSLEELAEQLESLGAAPWLQGVLLRVQSLHVDMATAHALRRCIAALGRAGKQTVASLARLDWTSTYVASAADVVAAPESAELQLFGLAAWTLFMRDGLAKLGVRFEKIASGEYKSAYDELIRQRMSEAHREQVEALLEVLVGQFTAELAASRGLDADELRRAMDEGIVSAAQARELGIIDRVAYEDELLTDEHAPLGRAMRFLRVRPRPWGGPRVAVISLEGAIACGRSRRTPLGLAMPIAGGVLAGSETVVRTLRAAEADERTAAVVLYVHSGGGSALASDLIGREVKRVAARKPVVGVMGAVAASGGYYVLAQASRIVAAPTTITGSIGVLTGKLVLEQCFERCGLRAEQVRQGRYALLTDPSTPYDDDERALLERLNDEVYRRFIDRVAEGRKLSPERVDELGRGRIWSGMDAHRLGLVDELGDIHVGIQRACDLAGISRQAATWNAGAPMDLLLPAPRDAASLARLLEPLWREQTLMLHPAMLFIH